PDERPDRSTRRGMPGFDEESEEAGITFKMKYLPGEQGENFRANLYDHGCGVAIADFDGDGHDDVYFVNQLGPNALYRNNGDGTFTDVTKQSGVDVGDRSGAAAVFADSGDYGPQERVISRRRVCQLSLRT